jgi:hypothetical protein
MGRFGHLYPWQVVTRLAGLNLTCRLRRDDHFDAEKISAEVDTILKQYAPASHSSSGTYHDGGWGAVGLVSHKADPFEDRPLGPPYEKTPALSLAPYIESVIDSFATEKKRIRLMELRPGKSVFWHYDKGETIDTGQSVRLHIPVVTNKDVQLQLCHEDVFWKPGELWYGDFSFPHRLYNGGAQTRIHLVLDLKINDYILSLFPQKFLAEKQKRGRVKTICQKMVAAYQISSGPILDRLHRVPALATASRNRS